MHSEHHLGAHESRSARLLPSSRRGGAACDAPPPLLSLVPGSLPRRRFSIFLSSPTLDTHLPTGNGVVGSAGMPPRGLSLPLAAYDEDAGHAPAMPPTLPGCASPPPAAALTARRFALGGSVQDACVRIDRGTTDDGLAGSSVMQAALTVKIILKRERSS